MDRTLWDTNGNYCRVEMHCICVNVFEVYFHDFNNAIPRRHVGSIGECNNKIDLWLSRQTRSGFVEQSEPFTCAVRV